MSQWARLVAVILTVGVVAACSSSDSSSEELDELRAELAALNDQLDEREERITELEGSVDALESAPPPEPTPPPADDPEPPVDRSDVEAILPLVSDLPDGWDEDPFIADLGFGQVGADVLLASPCGLGPTGDLDDPVAAVQTGFTQGGFAGPIMVVAVLRFDDPGLERAFGRLVADSVDCDLTFEDSEGTFTTGPLDLAVDGAEIAATQSSAEVEESSFAVGGDSHDVFARVGPYVLVVSHFAEEATPDLDTTSAVVELLVSRAQELTAG